MNNRKASIVILLFCVITSIGVAQTDTLNQRNSAGKKNGYWKIYLDSNADPADSSQSFFYAYDLWDNGESVFEFRKHQWAFTRTVFDGTLPEKGKPVLLNGTFKWFDEKGLLRNEETYKDGHPLFIKSYNWDKENPAISVFNEVCYFDKLYNNIPGTFYYEEYGYNSVLIGKWWYRKGKRGWRVYKIKE